MLINSIGQLEVQELVENKIFTTGPSYLYGLKRSDQLLLSYLTNHMNRSVFKRSHQCIALAIGVNEKTVRRSFIHLRNLGLLWWTSQLKRINIYRFTPLFFTSTVQNSIRSWASYFSRLFLSLLWSQKPNPENVRLINSKGIIKNGSHRVTRVEGENYAALKQEAPSFLNSTIQFFSKKGERMQKSAHQRYEIINKISKRLRLTPHGLIALKKYPDQALDNLYPVIDIALKQQNPFTYILKICENYCRKNNLSVERKQYEHERISLEISAMDDNFLDSEWLEGIRNERKREPNSARIKHDFSSFKEPTEQELIKTMEEVVELAPINQFHRLLIDGWKKQLAT